MVPSANASNASLLFACLCRLLRAFANCLDPDQARQNVGPDLDPKLFNTLIILLQDLFEKLILKNPLMTLASKK